MSTRERTLAFILIGFIVLAANLFGAYFLLWSPIQASKGEAAKLNADIDTTRAEVTAVRKNAPKLAEYRRRSLPADEARARQAYADLIESLLRKAHVPVGFKITPKQVDQKSVPTVTVGTIKKPLYTRVALEVTFAKADLWAVHDFLTGYYKQNLLHQITALNIRREEDNTARRSGGSASTSAASAPRNDLTVTLTTEAIILDGAEDRRTALPVPAGFAAAGGLRGFHAVALTPAAGLGLTPQQFAQVLSPKNRDYSLIVKKDVFHGPYPDAEPLRMGRIAAVEMKAGDKSPAVKVPLSGDFGVLGRVSIAAKADGSLIPTGGLKVDQQGRTISIAPAAGQTGTATVSVTATAANGQTVTGSFKVTVAEGAVAAEKPKEDIAADIRLVGVSTGSDGTATALVKDFYSPHDYVVEVAGKAVKVEKFYYLGARRKADTMYFSPKHLHISDDISGTERKFQVIGVEHDALILLDVKPPKPAAEPVKAADPKAGGPPGKGGFPQKGAFTPMGGPSKAPAVKAPARPPLNVPLAAAVGVPGAAAAPHGPLVYRWTAGAPLSKLVPVPADEAKKILQKAEQSGPVGAMAHQQ